MATVEDVMKELAKTNDDLGTYTARAGEEKIGSLEATMKLRAELRFVAGIDSGDDKYFADVEFRRIVGNPCFGEFVPTTDKDGHGKDDWIVKYNCNANNLADIFTRLSKYCRGIEGMLQCRPDYVLHCVFELEKQTKHIYSERIKAQEERKKKLNLS